MKHQPIIIIGMHRSGTSMLTRFIEESGIYMGKEKGVNDESFFFQKINDWILYEAGATWDNSYNIKFINDYFISHMVNVIDKRLSSIWIKKYFGIKNTIKYGSIYNQENQWGWKDPRTTLTLPVWKKLFPNAKIVHIYRNPIDIAASLRKRECQIEKNYKNTLRKKYFQYFLKKKPVFYQSSRVHNVYEGIKLWKEYVSLALSANDLFDDVIHIKYEDFLNKPMGTLKDLSLFLNLNFDELLVNSIVEKIDKSRSYAFLNDLELVDIFNKVKDDNLMKKLGYSNINIKSGEN